METTYTVKSKKSDILLEFKYNLNGGLTQFNIIEGDFKEEHAKWLFSHRFPYSEKGMEVFQYSFKDFFEITKGAPDLSFDTFWNTYAQKVKKVMAENAWKRLSNRDKMNALAGIKSYDNYLKRKGVAKAHPSTYLNQRYWEDNYGSIH